MKLLRKQLLATVTGLTLAFGSAAYGQVTTQKERPQDLQTVTQNYNTKDSKELAALEGRINTNRPSHTPRIVYIDPDHMSTWLQLTANVNAYPSMLAQYLATKNVTTISVPALAGIASASLSVQPAAAVPQLSGAKGEQLDGAACLVTPYNPSLPANLYLRKQFLLGNPSTGQSADALSGRSLDVSINRQQMAEIVNAREAWRCFDNIYTAQFTTTTNFDRVMALHRHETFADLGGLMQAVKDGAPTQLIEEFADFRAAMTGLTESPRGKVFKAGETPFYGSVVYATYPALTELQSRIDKMGVEKFREMTPEQMRDMANDIVTQKSLTDKQGLQLMGVALLGPDYFKSLEAGGAPKEKIDEARSFVVSILKQRATAIERAVKPAAPGEAYVELVPGEMIYELAARAIEGDKAVAANPDDIGARLKARQKLMDEVREKADANPAHGALMMQIMHGIFNSDPWLERGKPEPPPAPKIPMHRA
ncbi:MAG: hypothetical protein ACAH80_03875 [Alphaproteobacteria bacterium]